MFLRAHARGNWPRIGQADGGGGGGAWGNGMV